MKIYFLITSVIYVLHIIVVVPNSVDGTVLQDGTLSHLILLIQKSNLQTSQGKLHQES